MCELMMRKLDMLHVCSSFVAGLLGSNCFAMEKNLKLTHSLKLTQALTHHESEQDDGHHHRDVGVEGPWKVAGSLTSTSGGDQVGGGRQGRWGKHGGRSGWHIIHVVCQRIATHCRADADFGRRTTRLVSTTAHAGTSANFFNAVIPRAPIKPPTTAVAANAFLLSFFLL